MRRRVSSRHRPRSMPWPAYTRSTRTPRWSQAPRTSGCGSPSRCGPCQRSFTWGGWPVWRTCARPKRASVSAPASTYAGAERAMAAIDPDLVELFRRLGAKQVRAVGTLGGNIANGSPIGDTPPALIALGTTLHLRRGQATRSMPLEDFFIDYGKQDLAAGEFVTGIDVPRLKSRRGLPLLQDLQALRSGHLRPPGRLQVHRGGGSRHARACRLRWHGGHAEARRRRGSRSQGPAACGSARLGRRLRGPGVGFFSPSTTCGPAPGTGWRRRRRSCARPCTRRAAKQAPRPGSLGLRPGGTERAA